jgi:hypothetical protein
MALTLLDTKNPQAKELMAALDTLADGLYGVLRCYGRILSAGVLGVEEFETRYGITNGSTQALELFTRLTAIHDGNYTGIKVLVDQVMADTIPPVV